MQKRNTSMSLGKVKSCIRAINYQLQSDSESESDSDFSMKRKGLARPKTKLREPEPETGLQFYNFYNNRIQLSNVHQHHVQRQHQEYPLPSPRAPVSPCNRASQAQIVFA